MRTQYGETAVLPVKICKTMKKGTLISTFHHAASKVNYIFAMRLMELIMTTNLNQSELKIETIQS